MPVAWVNFLVCRAEYSGRVAFMGNSAVFTGMIGVLRPLSSSAVLARAYQEVMPRLTI